MKKKSREEAEDRDFSSKIPNDLWAAYYDHPMAFELSSVKNSDSWLNIRKDVDSSAYIHKALLQRARTLTSNYPGEGDENCQRHRRSVYRR